MSTPQTLVTPCRPWLHLAVATLAAGLMASAQAPDTAPAASAGGHIGNILGKVAAGKGVSIVWVEATPAMTLAKPAKPFTISQKALRFEPHILAVPVGATIDFLNNDSVPHNIFWPAIGGNKKLSHSLGTFPKGQTRLFQFTTPGIVPLLCNVHPEMAAYLIVTPTPYLAETDDSGSYKIADVPDGSYTVTAWHEGFKTQTKPVTVASDARVDFALAK